MHTTIDLAADIGEGFGSYTMGDDARILDAVSSANVACGFHAGDPRTMESSVTACLDRGVAIGAHPGFPDMVGFGRRAMDLSPDEVRTDVLYQIGALQAFATAAGTRVGHVSPHGRLGNLVVTSDAYAVPVLDAIESLDPTLVVVTYSGRLEQLARERGLRVGLMAFPDRAYEDDGSLASRREPGAVIHDPELIAERAVTLATDGTVTSRSGAVIQVECHSLLLHGDNAASVDAAHLVRGHLDRAGVVISPLLAK
ncbi:MAG: 5-oxoprolinase subunit PxpA [Aeromicrobium sp.]